MRLAIATVPVQLTVPVLVANYIITTPTPTPTVKSMITPQALVVAWLALTLRELAHPCYLPPPTMNTSLFFPSLFPSNSINNINNNKAPLSCCSETRLQMNLVDKRYPRK